MSEEIQDGSLSWKARIDTTEVAQDVRSIAELFNSVGANFDVSEIDKILKEQAEREVDYRNDAATQTVKINEYIFNDTKQKADDIQKLNAGLSLNKIVESEDQQLTGIVSKIQAVSQAEKDLVQQQIEAAAFYKQQGGSINFPQQKIQSTSIQDVLGADYTDVLNKAKVAFESLDDESKEFITNLASLRASLEQVQNAQQKLIEANADGKISTAEFSSATIILDNQQKILTETISSLVQAQKNYDEASNQITGSINERVATLASLRNEYADLSETERNSAFGKQTLANIQSLDAEIKTINDNLKAVQNNAGLIGQKTSQIKSLKGQLLSETDVTQIKSYNAQIQTLELEINQLKNIGKAGFDNLGNPIKKELDTVSSAAENTTGKTNLLSKSFGFLRQAAYVLPGIGIAGIFNIVSQAIVQVISNLDILKDKQTIIDEVFTGTDDKTQALKNSLADYGDTASKIAEGALQDLSKAEEKLNDQLGLTPSAVDKAKAALEILQAEAKKTKANIDALNQTPSSDGGESGGLGNVAAIAYEKSLQDNLTQQQKLTNQLEETARKQRDADNEESLKEQTEKNTKFAEQQIQSNIDKNNAILANDKATYQEKLNALKENLDAQLQLNQIEKNKSLNAADTPIKKEEAQNDFNAANAKAETDYLREKQSLEERSSKSAQTEEEKINAILRERQSILEKLSSLQRDSAQSGLLKDESEVDKVKEKYEQAFRAIDDYNKKVDDFNKLHNTNINGISVADIDKLKSAEAVEIANTQYKQDAANYIASVDDKKRAFDELKSIQEQGNDDVTTYAEQTYKTQLQGFASYIDYLKNQIAGISFEIAINGPNVGLLTSLDALKKKLTVEQNNVNTQDNSQKVKDYTSALQAAATFNDKREQLEKQYNKDVQSLELNTNDKELADHLATRKKQYEQDLTDLQNNLLRQSALYQQLNEDIISFTRDQLKKRIDLLKKELEDGFVIDVKTGVKTELTPQMKSDLQSAIDGAQNLFVSTDKTVTNLNKVADKSNEIGSAFNELGSAVSSINKELGDSLQFIGNMITGLGKAATSLSDLKKAQDENDVAGELSAGIGVASAVISVATTIFNTIKASHDSRIQADKDLKAYEDSLFTNELAYNQLLRERQDTLADISKLNIDELQRQKEQLELSKQQALADEQRLLNLIQQQGQQITGEHEEKSGGSFLLGAVGLLAGFGKKTQTVQDLAGLSGADFDALEKLYTENKLTDETKAWFEQLKSVHDELDDIGASAQDVVDQLNQALTGTTADSIADSIIQGFASGKTAVADFADDFKSLMRNAILQSLKYSALQQPLNDFYNQFAADAASDNVLTQSEITDLQSKYNAIIDNASKQFQDLKDITNIDFTADSSNPNTLEGGFKALTENTGELLAGQFGGLRITSMEILNVNKEMLNNSIQNLNYLNQIAGNTAYIISVDNRLRDMQNNGIKLK